MTAAKVQQVLPEIVRLLRATFDPCTIYLYGSCAYGTPQRDSDVDLLIVVPDSPLDFFERSAQAYRALRDVDVPMDLQVYTRSEFDSRAALPVSFERTVRTKGRVLHAA